MGISLLPVVMAVSVGIYKQLGHIHALSGNQPYFFLGAVSYAVLHLFIYKPTYLYVFGHELAHALTTVICGGRVGSLRVSSSGGQVSTTKSNFFINLAPYFLPMYTIFFFLIYLLLSIFYNISAFLPHFIFLIGFSLTFHLVLTTDTLRARQTDILKTGYLFSLSLIYIVNLTLLAFILSSLFSEISLGEFFRSTYIFSKQIYLAVFNQLF